jgi:DNA repair protein Crb2 Tudor domain
MTSGGTQRSDRTDPLSQWAYESVTAQSRSCITTATGAFRTAPETRTYRTGDVGHVDLELEETGPATGAFETQEVEDLQDLPLEAEEHLTELYPHSQRFQLPKTPASNARKRKRGSDGANPFATPHLPANPFGSSATKAGAPMRMSQIFHTSSPFTNHLPSDPPPSRPSPNFNDIERTSTAQAVSSPARPTQYRRAVTEPHANWKSQNNQKSASHASSPSINALDDSGSASDSDFGMPSSQARRQALRAEKAKASRELRSVDNSRGLSYSQQGQITRSRTAQLRSSEQQSGLRTTKPALRPDPPESEEETDIEGSPVANSTFAGNDDDADELGENNKENIYQSTPQPPGEVRNHLRSAAKLRVHRQRHDGRPTRSSKSGYGSEDELADPSPTRGQQQDISLSQSNGEKTIADSQRSPRIRECKLPQASDVIPKSTDDSSKVIRESQTLKIATSSPPIDSSRVKVAAASSLGPSASSPSVQSIGISTKVQPDGNQRSSSSGDQQLSGRHQENPRRARKSIPTSDQTPSRNDPPSIAIPETNVIERFQQPRRVLRAAPFDNLPKFDSKESRFLSQETGLYHSARTQPKASTEQPSSLVTPDSSQPSSGPNVSQPMPLMEIGRNATAFQEESISLSPEILKSNDPLYDEVMEKYSSPISAARKRRAREDAMRETHRESMTVDAAEKPADETKNGVMTASDSAFPNEQAPTSAKSAQAGPEQAGLVQELNEVTGNADTAADHTEDQPNQVAEGVDVELNPSSGLPSVRRKNARKRAPQPRQQASHMQGNAPADASSGAKTEVPPVQESRIAGPVMQALRVLGYFSSSRPGFYPATCLEVAPTEPKFKVQFDDGNITQLNSSKVKPFVLQPGDSVRIDRKGLRNISYIVQRCGPAAEGDDLSIADNNGNSTVVVRRSTTSSSDDEYEVFPVAAIYLTNQTWTAFKREFTHENLARLSDASGPRTPSEHPSSPVPPNSRTCASRLDLKESNRHLNHEHSDSRSGLFGSMLFALTNINPLAIREETISLITNHGGVVLTDGLEGLFDLPFQEESRPSTATSRTTPVKRAHRSSSSALTPLTSSPAPQAPPDLQPRPQFRNQSIFLLAGRHCRHTKYFQALALGIPCLSVRWVEHCISASALLPWHSYLLASGESSYLDNAILSQSFPIGSSLRFALHSLIAQRPKLLSNARVILLSLDSSRAHQLDAHKFLSLALGATEVWRAPTLDLAHAALEARNSDPAAKKPWTLVIANASDIVDTKASTLPPSSSGRPTKRKKGPRKEREDEAEGPTEVLTSLVSPYAGLRGVSTEFVIQSLILGRLL